jgi:hypothetical protein
MSLKQIRRLLATVLVVFMIHSLPLKIANAFQGSGQNVWSEEKVLYTYANQPDEREFYADVHKEIIRLVGGYRYLEDGRFLGDSKIFYLQKSGRDQPNIQLLPTSDYPSEQPILLRDSSGNAHFIWGDRRQDPDFEQWQTERPQVVAFSTNVIYSRLIDNDFEESKSIYEGHLQEIMGGYGDITFPFRLIEDDQNQLHTVFVADSTFRTSKPNGEEIIAGSLRITHLTKKETDKWSSPQYLAAGVEPDIISLPEGRMVMAYLGSVSDQPGFQNVLVITSDDYGVSWSEPDEVFLSGQQPGRMLNMEVGPNGRLHLIWGRQTQGLPIPNEMWHSYSEDGGENWSSPEKFFNPSQSSENEKIIGDFDLVIDRFGQLHWAGVIREIQGSGILNYMTWNPGNKSWKQAKKLDFAKNPRQDVDLSIDDSSDKLYLFWDELDEDAIYYSTKEVSESELLPVIAKSGPLQLNANYPNPFNPSTRISFTLEEPAEVVLTVFDISGRQIMQENLGTKQAGLHSEEVNLEGLTSGMYIYEVELNNTWRQQSTMMLIK